MSLTAVRALIARGGPARGATRPCYVSCRIPVTPQAQDRGRVMAHSSPVPRIGHIPKDIGHIPKDTGQGLAEGAVVVEDDIGAGSSGRRD